MNIAQHILILYNLYSIIYLTFTYCCYITNVMQYLSLSIYIYIYTHTPVYIYIYTYICMYTCICVFLLSSLVVLPFSSLVACHIAGLLVSVLSCFSPFAPVAALSLALSFFFLVCVCVCLCSAFCGHFGTFSLNSCSNTKKHLVLSAVFRIVGGA